MVPQRYRGGNTNPMWTASHLCHNQPLQLLSIFVHYSSPPGYPHFLPGYLRCIQSQHPTQNLGALSNTQSSPPDPYVTTYSWVTYELKGKLSSLYTPGIYCTMLQQGQDNHHKISHWKKGRIGNTWCPWSMAIMKPCQAGIVKLLPWQ